MNNLINGKFIWQDDYWAVSVDDTNVIRIRKYILNQEVHHSKYNFQKELEKMNRKLH